MKSGRGVKIQGTAGHVETPSFSSRTHLQYHCLPHSSGISPSSFVTIAIRSLHCSSQPLELDRSIYESDGPSSSTSNQYQREEKKGDDTRLSQLPLIYNGSTPPSNSDLERYGPTYRVQATVTGLGLPLHVTPVQTPSSSSLRKTGTKDTTEKPFPATDCTLSCTWDETNGRNHNLSLHSERKNVLVLPVRYRDLSRDATISLQVITTGGELVATTHCTLWDQRGKLKMGLHRLKLLQGFNNMIDNRETCRDEEYSEEDEKWNASLIIDQLDQFQQTTMHQLEQKKAKYNTIHEDKDQCNLPSRDIVQEMSINNATSPLQPLPWLDKITRQHCMDILQDDLATEQCSVDRENPANGANFIDYVQHLFFSQNKKDQEAHLLIELPKCSLPVVYQEFSYPSMGSVTALDLSLHHHEQQRLLAAHQDNHSQINTVQREHADSHRYHGLDYLHQLTVPMPSSHPADTDLASRGQYRFVQVLDNETEDDTCPVEDKYRTLQRELIRGLVDPLLKPDVEERNKLNAIIGGTSQHLTREEKDLLWKFRFSLVDNRFALAKFILCVDWTVEREVIQSAELLEQWKKRGPIEVTDALKLLGKNVAFQTDMVRAFAIDTLSAAPDAELSLYLLQLVQALKYENIAHHKNMNAKGRTRQKKMNDRPSSSTSSSLGAFLIERAVKNIELANYLYWYLKVELEDQTYGEKYLDVFASFREALMKTAYEDGKPELPKQRVSDDQNQSKLTAVLDSVSKLGASLTDAATGKTNVAQHTQSMWDIMNAQDSFIQGIMKCQKSSRDIRGKKDAKEMHLRDQLKSKSVRSIKNGISIPIPSAPHILVSGVKAESTRLFRSALYPALVECYVAEEKKQPTASESNHSPSGYNLDLTKSTYKVMFKTGDDLRQDQLVIMMIKLMDRILKRGTLDLCLKPYPILATSHTSGLVEFVEGSIPISQILSSHNNSILQFFKSVAPCEQTHLGVKKEVMQTYIRSCAGYCVITYLCMIGDRHLDNIMLQPTGHFFHIDFGFIFGRDPKPLPPPFRLTREMVDGMGGQESAGYRQFCSLACQAFNLLRKKAGLLLQLLHLMSDAGIEDLSNNPSADAEGVISKVEERFRLELTDEQAESYFLGLINDSLTALAPRVMDVFHSLSVARR